MKEKTKNASSSGRKRSKKAEDIGEFQCQNFSFEYTIEYLYMMYMRVQEKEETAMTTTGGGKGRHKKHQPVAREEEEKDAETIEVSHYWNPKVVNVLKSGNSSPLAQQIPPRQ